MRKSNEQPIGEVIKDLLSAYKLEDKYGKTGLIEAWHNILGKAVSSRTDSIYIKGNVLYVKLNSSVLRNELSMAKTKLINNLNEEAGKTIITDIVFK